MTEIRGIQPKNCGNRRGRLGVARPRCDSGRVPRIGVGGRRGAGRGQSSGWAWPGPGVTVGVSPGSDWAWPRRWAWPELRVGVARPRCDSGRVPRIGLGVAEALGVAGAQVLISSRRAQNVQRAVERLRGRGLQVSGVTCHVGRAEERERMVQAALDTFGAIDILVSNAAVNPHFGPALEADESTWDKVFQVNVTAAAMLVRLVVPHMEKRGGGAIVLMSSIAGYQPMTGLGPYSVSKAALLGLVAALSPELLPAASAVNGRRRRARPHRFSAALWEDEATRERALRELGVQRLGTPQEVAQAVLFLVSPQASYVAGHTLLVAGGARPRL
ncbi:LOW QUALITY PROTEIN: dehydrogenase/reductase SDR family member 4-like [Camarhynchus parvulus]|uniref:LOW QUALITY PROTEIN: dehydrogenase/reductase SDR family member 4-like n=1 Tax=Geospiza parvula TaxID=87175 RepID=UPI001237CE58|nr:LOW QUALITY PROTEIN: dehydrogenase/reductase SDR family member 4-like [Camarhynchus parvulus]